MVACDCKGLDALTHISLPLYVSILFLIDLFQIIDLIRIQPSFGAI